MNYAAQHVILSKGESLAYWLSDVVQMKQVTRIIIGSFYSLLKDKGSSYIFMHHYFWAALMYWNIHRVSSCGANKSYIMLFIRQYIV